MANNTNLPDPNRLAEMCLIKFEQLPKTGKPIPNREWTVLSCIVQYNHSNDAIDIVALGTGTKCIGKELQSPNGDILNDSHSEIMCRRGFIRYIYNEISKHQSNLPSIISINRALRKYEINAEISFHLFSTHAPCGDASIFKSLISTKCNDEAPIAKKPKIEKPTQNDIDKCIEYGDILNEESNFTGAKLIATNYDVPIDLMAQNVGQLRTKPGRGIRTLSMSCSDKLARWNVMGIQGALLYSLLSKPIYLESIVLCGDQCDVEACERAIWKRWSTVQFDSPLPEQFRIARPIIRKCSKHVHFSYFKKHNLHPAPGSVVWCKVDERPLEVAVNGKKQGATKKTINSKSGRLLITKLELFQKYIDVLSASDHHKEYVEHISSYLDAKQRTKVHTNLWDTIKLQYFKIWTNKSEDLLKFTYK